MHGFANPTRFLRIARPLTPWLLGLGLALAGSALAWGLFVAPAERLQGDTALPADAQATLATLWPVAEGARQSLRLSIIPGEPYAEARDVVYSLPVEESKFTLGQGFHGGFSHDDEANRYAIDLVVDEGTPVLAARGNTGMATTRTAFERAQHYLSNLPLSTPDIRRALEAAVNNANYAILSAALAQGAAAVRGSCRLAGARCRRVRCTVHRAAQRGSVPGGRPWARA